MTESTLSPERVLILIDCTGRGARGARLPRRLEGSSCAGEGPDDKCSDAAHRRVLFLSLAGVERYL